MKKGKYFTTKGRRSFLIAIFILAVLFVGLLLIQFYLYFNFLLGNDIAVRVGADKEFLELRQGDREEIEVSVKVFTNPFCDTNCDYSFLNLATNEKLKSGTFLLSNSEPFSEKYVVEAPTKGTGEVIYRFEILCASSENFFCYTGAKPFYQNALVVMDYDLTDEGLLLKNKTKSEISNLLTNFSYWEDYFSDLNAKSAASPLQIDGIDEKINDATSTKKEIIDIKKLWETEEYSAASNYLDSVSENYKALATEFFGFKNESDNVVYEFNEAVDEFNPAQIDFMEIVTLNFSDASVQNANYSSLKFVIARNSFLLKGTLTEKESNLAAMNESLAGLRDLIQDDLLNGLERNNSLGLKFNVTLAGKIELNESWEYEIDFVEPEKKCCLFESCGKCCENCQTDESLYPVIFLHGHDFSSQISAEYNLNIFGNLQKKLEKDGLLNAGTMMINSPEEIPEGIWGQIRQPISVKMSYYFDSVTEEGKLNIHQTKKDNIDTYSIRLKNIVDSVKKKTGKEKVILVTHSMGGLVARRYLQIFGEDDVYKLIMIGSPNRGISESVSTYCTTFGEAEECQDMKKGSLFQNKLKDLKVTNVEVFNIVGVGCDTDGEDGDGIVQKDSAVIDGAENYFVNGTCSGFEYLHSNIVEPDEYPETYEIVKKILED